MPHPADVRAAPGSRLVQLKRGSRPDRLLLVPGAAGSPLSFVSLARAYPGPETVEVLEAPPRPATSIGALVHGHLLALRTLGRDCPWHLAGHAFGACVALEMAARAERSGWRPRTIALVAPLLRLGGELDAGERDAARDRLGATERLRARLQAAGADRPDRLADDVDVCRDLADLDLDPALLRSGVDFAVSLLTHMASALHAYLEATPPRVAAPVQLLVGAEPRTAVEPIERRLRELTGGVTVHELPYAPSDLLRPPGAREVARRLAALAAG